MVCKLLENGSVKKNFFQRYGDNLDKILQNEKEQQSIQHSTYEHIIDHLAETKEAHNRNLPNRQAISSEKFIKKKKVAMVAYNLSKSIRNPEEEMIANRELKQKKWADA